MPGVKGAHERAEGGRRAARYEVTLTADEAAAIRALAAEAGTSVPRLLVETVLARRGPVPLTRDDRRRVLPVLLRLQDDVCRAAGGGGWDDRADAILDRLDGLVELWRMPGDHEGRAPVAGARVAARDVRVGHLRELRGELVAIRRQLAGVARNVNQLTRTAHGTGKLRVGELLAALEWLHGVAGPGGRLDRAAAAVSGEEQHPAA